MTAPTLIFVWILSSPGFYLRHLQLIVKILLIQFSSFLNVTVGPISSTPFWKPTDPVGIPNDNDIH